MSFEVLANNTLKRIRFYEVTVKYQSHSKPREKGFQKREKASEKSFAEQTEVCFFTFVEAHEYLRTV